MESTDLIELYFRRLLDRAREFSADAVAFEVECGGFVGALIEHSIPPDPEAVRDRAQALKAACTGLLKVVREAEKAAQCFEDNAAALRKADILCEELEQ